MMVPTSQNNLIGSEPAECKVQQQTMNPWDEIPRRVRPSFALRSKRVNVMSPSFRELHRGQRSCAAPKGRTYDRTVPEVKSTEKLLHRRAVPHMRKNLHATTVRATATWVLFLIGGLARPNALFAAVPLGIYLYSPRTALGAGKPIAIAALVLIGLWLGNWLISYPLLNAQRTYAINSIVTFDLAGISHFSGKNYFPLSWSTGETEKIVNACYTPQSWNPYFVGDCQFVWKQLHDEGVWGSASFWHDWFAAIAAEPTAYLQHRLAHFFHFTTTVGYVFHDGNDAE